jgi:hypothetical protein
VDITPKASDLPISTDTIRDHLFARAIIDCKKKPGALENLDSCQRHFMKAIIPLTADFEGRPRGISELGCLVSTPWTHKSFIDKRRLISQAGRRRQAAGNCRLTGGNSENRCSLAHIMAMWRRRTVFGISLADFFCLEVLLKWGAMILGISRA